MRYINQRFSYLLSYITAMLRAYSVFSFTHSHIFFLWEFIHWLSYCWYTLHSVFLQRRFTKRLPGLKYKSYNKRLRYLGLHSLELRRLHFDLIYWYKISLVR